MSSPVDTMVLLFFLAHIPVTVFIDSQAGLPAEPAPRSPPARASCWTKGCVYLLFSILMEQALCSAQCFRPIGFPAGP